MSILNSYYYCDSKYYKWSPDVHVFAYLYRVYEPMVYISYELKKGDELFYTDVFDAYLKICHR